MQDTMSNQNPAAADAGETKLDAEPAGGFYLVIERYLSEAQALRYWLAGLIAIALLVGLLVTLLHCAAAEQPLRRERPQRLA